MRALVPSLLLASACSVYALQEGRLDRQFAAAGLVAHTLPLGPTDLRFRVGGKGPPLLLIHGFGGDGRFTWAEQLPLADSHRLIVPDLVWFGGSTSTAEPSIAEQTRALLALLDHLGHDRVDVAGISYGGMVTWRLVAQHPERFGRVVLVDTTGDQWTQQDHDEMLVRMGLQDISELILPADAEGVGRLLDLAYHEPPWVPGFVKEDVLRSGIQAQLPQKRALLAELGRLRDEGPPPAWTVTPPTLVVWGEHDPLFPLAHGRKLATSLGADLVVIDRASHGPNLERPEAFNAALGAFLAGPIPPPPEVAPAEPTFAFEARPLSLDERTTMIGVSWREGCPVPLDDLRRVELSYWHFDGAPRAGALVVHEGAVDVVRAAFAAAFDERFPFERIEPIEAFDGSDDLSMARNNTSAFNCRAITGGEGFSEHSYGHAIDINPVQNPYVRGEVVLPPAGDLYLDRAELRPGMLGPESALVRVFRDAGWGWGGSWTRVVDYQHVSATGR